MNRIVFHLDAREFGVTPDVSIPRPGTELLVETVLKTGPRSPVIVADLRAP